MFYHKLRWNFKVQTINVMLFFPKTTRLLLLLLFIYWFFFFFLKLVQWTFKIKTLCISMVNSELSFNKCKYKVQMTTNVNLKQHIVYWVKQNVNCKMTCRLSWVAATARKAFAVKKKIPIFYTNLFSLSFFFLKETPI